MQAIKAQIAQGITSELVIREMGRSMDADIQALKDQFAEALPIYYQKIDNHIFLVLHLKLRCLIELRDQHLVNVDKGRSAQTEKSELEAQGVKFDE